MRLVEETLLLLAGVSHRTDPPDGPSRTGDLRLFQDELDRVFGPAV